MPQQPIAAPATSDEFDAPKLGFQWQWQGNPQPGWHSLETTGSLRLKAVAVPATGYFDAPNLLMQKFPSPEFTATTVLDASALADSQEAGLMVFGYSYAWLGLRRDAKGFRLVHVTDIERSSPAGNATPTAVEVSQPLPGERLFLRVAVDQTARCQFSYSTDGKTFRSIDTGREFYATPSRWVGAKVGVFASQRQGTPLADGHASFDWFRVVR